MAERNDNRRDKDDKRRNEKPTLDEVWPVHSAGRKNCPSTDL